MYQLYGQPLRQLFETDDQFRDELFDGLDECPAVELTLIDLQWLQVDIFGPIFKKYSINLLGVGRGLGLSVGRLHARAPIPSVSALWPTARLAEAMSGGQRRVGGRLLCERKVSGKWGWGGKSYQK